MNPKLAPWAFLCGCAALIPLPFVDEYVERRLTRTLYTGIAESHGHALSDEALGVLTEDRSSMAMGCLYVALVWPLKKLFRTVLYFLTVKDVLDGTTRAAHRATFVDIAFAEGLLPGHPEAVRSAMEALLGKVRYSPVTRPLYLQERPEPPWPRAGGFARLVHFLQHHGGAGILVPQFHARLAALREGGS